MITVCLVIEKMKIAVWLNAKVRIVVWLTTFLRSEIEWVFAESIVHEAIILVLILIFAIQIAIELFVMNNLLSCDQNQFREDDQWRLR